MKKLSSRPIRSALLLCCSTLVVGGASAQANTGPTAKKKIATRAAVKPSASAAEQLEAMQKQMAEQAREIKALKESVAEQNKKFRTLQHAKAAEPRGQQHAGAQPARPVQPGHAAPATMAEAGPRPVQVGAAPREEHLVPNIAQVFEQPGILTPKGKGILEPSLQYSYSSSNQVALVGYTVIPALLIGLIDIRSQRQNTVTAAMTGRYGVTNRLELEAKLPYVYRSNSTVSREMFTGTAQDDVFDTKGKSLGDAEMTARYQFNDAKNGWPYLIGSLRYKSRTGKDPFQVVTDCVTRCVGNTTGTGLPLDLPTGSGFNMVQPGITWLMPSDPVVFFGSFSYGYNFKRSNVSRHVLNGAVEQLGDVKAGNILGMNFGMGMALNDKSSFSLGVDLNSVGRTTQNGKPVAGSVRTQLSTLLLGYSYRLSPKQTLNISVGAGLTRDTPDLTLTARLPISF